MYVENEIKSRKKSTKETFVGNKIDVKLIFHINMNNEQINRNGQYDQRGLLCFFL